VDFLYSLGGFTGLVIGGDYLVRGAVAIAQQWRISPMVIGLTLVGFGTSTPELVTSVQAALQGAPGIAIGNVVGSNTANILLILGAAAVILPLSVNRSDFRRDGTALMLVTLVCVGIVLYGFVGRSAGVALLVALAAYLFLAFRSGEAAAELPVSGEAPGAPWLIMLGGLVLTILAARFLVQGAIALAAGLGVSEAVIGVTIVAVGTSMPELVTSVVAAQRGQADVALGNVIGSNLFNILGILGATAVISPMTVPDQIAGFDIWVMLAATALLVVAAVTGWQITRREGLLLLTGYLAYIAVLTAMVI
jgi:cation:H+ antiporter